MSVPSRPVAILAMLGSAACWGGATVMTKGALQAFDPFVLLVVQLGTSVTALWIAVVLTATRLPDRRRMTRAGATGLLEPGLAYAIGVPGLALTTAGNASVIAALEPVFIFIGVWLVFGARLGLRACLAVAVAVAGVILVSSGGGEGPGDGSVAGDGMVVLATILAAAYVLASSRLAASMSSVLLPALQQTVGLGLVLVLTAAALLAGWQSLPEEVTTPVVLLAAASGLVQYALAFWLYIVGMKALPAGIAGMFLTTTPIFGVLGGVIILGESFVGGQVLGMTLVIAALIALLGSKDARQV